MIYYGDNTYECTYSVSEGNHDYNYGVLKIEASKKEIESNRKTIDID